MFYFDLCSFLVVTGIGHSSAQPVSLCVCVCVCLISISLFVRSCFVIKEVKGYDDIFVLTYDVCNKRREEYDAIFCSFF